jgi:hypothetical protein
MNWLSQINQETKKKKKGNYFNSFLTSADVHVQSILIMLKELWFFESETPGGKP